MTPFADVPKSAPPVQFLSFSALCSARSSVASVQVRSFLTKEALLKSILWHWVTTGRMQLCLHLCTRCVKFSAEQKCGPVLYTNFEFWFIFQSTEHSTLQFKMRVYAVSSVAGNTLFQLRYLFDFTLCFFTSISFIWWMPQPNDT